MRFGDSRGMKEAFHDYWESRGCEALEREQRWPQRMDSRHISTLLYMQWAKASGLREESPLDLMMEEPGGEVRLEEPAEYIRLLEVLSRPVQRVEIRLWSKWERLAVGKWARIEEFVKERGKLRRVKAQLAKKRKKIYAERVEAMREGKGKFKNGVRYASVEELEHRAFEEERKPDRMAYMRAARWWNQAEIRRREIEMAKKKNEIYVEGKPELEEGEKEEANTRPEVELEVIRVGPNPRILVCRYKILAEELIVKLKVQTTAKFIRGMRIKMVEQEGEEWEYTGSLPRHKGRW